LACSSTAASAKALLGVGGQPADLLVTVRADDRDGGQVGQ
jgi:hypothetical protein